MYIHTILNLQVLCKLFSIVLPLAPSECCRSICRVFSKSSMEPTRSFHSSNVAYRCIINEQTILRWLLQFLTKTEVLEARQKFIEKFRTSEATPKISPKVPWILISEYSSLKPYFHSKVQLSTRLLFKVSESALKMFFQNFSSISDWIFQPQRVFPSKNRPML